MAQRSAALLAVARDTRAEQAALGYMPALMLQELGDRKRQAAHHNYRKTPHPGARMHRIAGTSSLQRPPERRVEQGRQTVALAQQRLALAAPNDSPARAWRRTGHSIAPNRDYQFHSEDKTTRPLSLSPDQPSWN